MRRRVTAIAATVVVAGSFLFVGQASAQQALVDPTITAEGECAPDGSTQGIVITVTNVNLEQIGIGPAAASGSLLAAPLSVPLTPGTLDPSMSATGDLSVPGDAAGQLLISVPWISETDGGTATASFDVTACEQPTTTTEATTTSTAAPARAAAATATFTG